MNRKKCGSLAVNNSNRKIIVMKKTRLFDIHQKLGAKIVDFAGFQMPVLYSSIIAEHKAVRNSVGVFDVSHMGGFYFR